MLKINKENNFVHLHLHTEFSMLDAACRIYSNTSHDLFSTLKEQNMKAVAITDHGNMFGVYSFYKKAIKNGIKPIIGCEMYVAEDMNIKNITNRSYDHMVLLAKNQQGYKNLIKLVSKAHTQGYYYKPRVDLDLIKKYSSGLICLTACLAGRVPKLLLENNFQKAVEYIKKLKDIFGEEDTYIELQDHGIEDQKRVLPLMLKLSKQTNTKVVATNDAHFLKREDSKAHEMLICMKFEKKIGDVNRHGLYNDEFYVKSYDEMYKLFGHIEGALENTVEIANKCEVIIEKEDLFPKYYPENGSSPNDFLRELVYKTIPEKYSVVTDEIKKRVDYELNVIINMGFAEYYLIVWDFIRYAKQNDIPVGPGRGSGVGSIVAYSIGITNVDPIRYSLLFERFLNPERVSNPDFDIDFCVEGRADVINYVIDKYGQENVCQIITYGTLAARNAFKSVARIFNISFPESNSIAQLINSRHTLTDALGYSNNEAKTSKEILELCEKNRTYNEIFDLARKVEGLPKNVSTHAAGVVICKHPIDDSIPIYKTPSTDTTTQFSKDEIEELGLLKMDFLGLRTLTDIAKTVKYVKELHGTTIDIDNLSHDDSNVYKMISTGETDGVFQLENAGMSRFMKNLKPENLDDIIAGISLYRPGPMKIISSYIEAKNNPEKITYQHPLLEKILKNTNGFIVYQEQVMQIVQELGGYTLGRADILRRAMSKKKADEMKKEREVFINGAPEQKEVLDEHGRVIKKYAKAVTGALKNGVTVEVANDLFDKMEEFSEYAFNKSHAAAYAVLSYQTAYLKNYYLLEFIVTVINNRIDNFTDVTKYLKFLKKKDIEILPPDINKSNMTYTVENAKVRYGLLGIKGVGEKALTEIIKEREANGEYTSFTDLVERVKLDAVTKGVLEPLILVGAFDSLNLNRRTLISNLEYVYKTVQAKNNSVKIDQTSLFDMFGMEREKLIFDIKELEEYPFNEKIRKEKEKGLIYISGHPLDRYRNLIKGLKVDMGLLSDLLEFKQQEDEDIETEIMQEEERRSLENKEIDIIAIVESIKSIQSKKTHKKYKIIQLGDGYVSIDAFVTSFCEDKLANIREDEPVRATIKIRFDQTIGRASLINIESLSDDIENEISNTEIEEEFSHLYINLKGKNEDTCNKILYICSQYEQKDSKGEILLWNYNNKNMKLVTKHKISQHLLDRLAEILGYSSLKTK